MYKRLVNIPCVNISVHIVSMKRSPLQASHYMCGCLGWFVGSPGETWMINSVHPFSLHPLCIGSVVHPAWLACMCVCAQGGRWFPHLRREPRASRPTVTCLEQSALPLPGLETTTARSCHQSADVVGEIYTETLKKQKDSRK